MKCIIEERELLEVFNPQDEDSILDIERTHHGFKIHINKKYTNLVTVDYFEEEHSEDIEEAKEG